MTQRLWTVCGHLTTPRATRSSMSATVAELGQELARVLPTWHVGVSGGRWLDSRRNEAIPARLRSLRRRPPAASDKRRPAATMPSSDMSAAPVRSAPALPRLPTPAGSRPQHRHAGRWPRRSPVSRSRPIATRVPSATRGLSSASASRRPAGSPRAATASHPSAARMRLSAGLNPVRSALRVGKPWN